MEKLSGHGLCEDMWVMQSDVFRKGGVKGSLMTCLKSSRDQVRRDSRSVVLTEQELIFEVEVRNHLHTKPERDLEGESYVDGGDADSDVALTASRVEDGRDDSDGRV